MEANLTTYFPLENLWFCATYSVSHGDCYYWHALEQTWALSCPIPYPLARALAPVICRDLCALLCHPTVEKAQDATAKWRC